MEAWQSPQGTSQNTDIQTPPCGKRVSKCGIVYTPANYTVTPVAEMPREWLQSMGSIDLWSAAGLRGGLEEEGTSRNV